MAQQLYQVYRRHPVRPEVLDAATPRPDTFAGAREWWGRMNFDSDMRGTLILLPDAGRRLIITDGCE